MLNTASWAGVGGSSWIHGDDWYSSDLRFVVDELSELMEAPRVVAATLRPSNRCLAAYAFQVFKGDCAASVFGFRHQTLTDIMIRVSPVAGFVSAELLQVSLGTF